MSFNASSFRIEQVRNVFVNGRAAKVFNAFERRGNAFIFCGQFKAPRRTPNRDLWKIAAQP